MTTRIRFNSIVSVISFNTDEDVTIHKKSETTLDKNIISTELFSSIRKYELSYSFIERRFDSPHYDYTILKTECAHLISKIERHILSYEDLKLRREEHLAAEKHLDSLKILVQKVHHLKTFIHLELTAL